MVFDYFLMYISIGVGYNIGSLCEVCNSKNFEAVKGLNHILFNISFLIIILGWPFFLVGYIIESSSLANDL